MELILQVFYSFFSGCMLSLSIPNEIYEFGSPVFTLFAFIPYYILFSKKINKNFQTTKREYPDTPSPAVQGYSP